MLKKLKKNAFVIITLAPACIFIIGFFVVIAFFLLKLSLTTYIGGMEQETGVITNYISLITSSAFKDAFWRTLLFVLTSTPLQLVTGLITAMLINKSFTGRGIVRSIMLLPLAIPTIVTTSILVLMFSKGGHIGSLLTGQYPLFPQLIEKEFSFLNTESLAIGLSIFGKVWRDTPISMLILLAGLQQIPEDQYEAAKTMGSKFYQNFSYITLPLLIPAISSVLVLRSVEAWKEFIFPYILAPSFPVLGVLIENFYVQQRNPGMSAAIGIMLIFLILVFTWLLKEILQRLSKFLVKV